MFNIIQIKLFFTISTFYYISIDVFTCIIFIHFELFYEKIQIILKREKVDRKND